MQILCFLHCNKPVSYLKPKLDIRDKRTENSSRSIHEMVTISPDRRSVTCNPLASEACTGAMEMKLTDIRGTTPFVAGNWDIVVLSVVQRT